MTFDMYWPLRYQSNVFCWFEATHKKQLGSTALAIRGSTLTLKGGLYATHPRALPCWPGALPWCLLCVALGSVAFVCFVLIPSTLLGAARCCSAFLCSALPYTASLHCRVVVCFGSLCVLLRFVCSALLCFVWPFSVWLGLSLCCFAVDALRGVAFVSS
jgi:hypothetical protein